MSTPRLARNVLASLLDARAKVAVRPRPIRLGNAQVGVIHELVWHRRQVSVLGQTSLGTVNFSFDGRAPIAAGSDNFEFTLDRPAKTAGLNLQFQCDQYESILRFPPPGIAREVYARLASLPGAICEVLAEAGTVLNFLSSGDVTTATRLRRRFGLTDCKGHKFTFPGNFFTDDQNFSEPSEPPIIILPVHNAFADLDRLAMNLAARTLMDHRLILIDDASDDIRVTRLLNRMKRAAPDRTTLIRFPLNMGFVAAVNAGFEAARKIGGGHIVLLNSDTLPPPNWLARLLSPIIVNPDVATVTPLSNNAEILSIPTSGTISELGPELVDSLDLVARRIAPCYAQVALPTGIGFCMALNRRYLDMIGYFDRGFGRGYGEEVDWCQKASRAGGKHIAATNLFVGHAGGSSFGSEKASRIKSAGRKVSERYPDYDRSVQTWVSNAPIAAQRLALSLAWLNQVSAAPVPIFLGHSLGGGAETALSTTISQCLRKGAPGVIVMRVGGRLTWQIELITPDSAQIGEVASADILAELLAPVRRRRVVYSCGVGAADPASVPGLLMGLTSGGVASLEIQLHDFFPISPSWNLLGRDGQYKGVPALNSDDTSHGLPRLNGRSCISHSEWRNRWSAVIDRADTITAFSPSSQSILIQAYPAAAGKIQVVPHRIPQAPPRINATGTAIGVLGGINRAKGAEVLLHLARELGQTPNRRLVLIGEIDGMYQLPSPHVVHGRYDHARINDLARAYEIRLWLTPSICPETFSFTTHEVLATGLPVLAFDLGAQADAVRAASNGHLVSSGPEDPAALLREIEATIKSATSP